MGRPPSIVCRMARAGAAALILAGTGVESFSLGGAGAGSRTVKEVVRPVADYKVLESTSVLPGLSFFGGAPGEGRRARTKTSPYGILDILLGPETSDLKTVDVPPELQARARTLWRSTAHLSRSGRITVLEALVRSYLSLRVLPDVDAKMTRMVSVACALGESEMDHEVMAAALLCEAPVEEGDVEAEFGAGVASILRGYERIVKVESVMEIRTLMVDYASKLGGRQGENLRNLVQAVANDWRAVTLRVAWKHVELDGPFASKRDKANACWAALNVYAVLAERAGMGLIKNAIEDRAFQYLMPEEYARIAEALSERRNSDEAVLRQARSELLMILNEDPIFQQAVARYEVKGRVKQPYSIWKKCRDRQCSVSDLHDLVALRVVCSPVAEAGDSADTLAQRGQELCYYVMSIVHKLRPHYVDRVKDYITNKKPNGYQSLHTTLQMRLRGQGYPFEVQIRTHAMHQTAEFGLASHFSYKGDQSLAHVMKDSKVEAPKSRGDFLTWLSKVLAQSEVYVWGPDGRLLNLSRGSTLLDVVKTYAVTKKVSKRVLRHWKLNGRRALLCRELQSGDVISSV